MRLIIISIFYFIFSFSLSAQEYVFEGKVSSSESKIPLPFSIIETEDERSYVTDLHGKFIIHHHLPYLNITVKNFYYITRDYHLSIFDEEEILLTPLQNIYVSQSTNPETAALIKLTLEKKTENNPETKGNFSYNTYNKLTVTTEDMEHLKVFLDDFLATNFKVNVWNFPNDDHHILLLESVTHRNFMNNLHNKEVVIGSQASGIDDTSIVTVSSFLHSLNVYNNTINIASNDYVSPLNNSALNTYYYNIEDTVYLPEETLYLVSFNPNDNRKDMVNGTMMISSENYAVKNISIATTFKSPGYAFHQLYEKTETGQWFTKQTKVDRVEKDPMGLGESVYINFITDYINIHFNRNFDPSEFDDITIEYQNTPDADLEDFWEKYRTAPLNEKEVNTYMFYESVGEVRNFPRLVRLGEGYFTGYIPIQFINVEYVKMLNFDLYEGLRVGLGLHTNERLSPIYSFGSYIAYGLVDKAFKYGAEGNLHLLPYDKLKLTLGYRDDIFEAAGLFFPFDKKQFNSEYIRRFGLRIFDRIRQPYLTFSSNPYKYLNLSLSVADQVITPLYEYRFMDLPLDHFKYIEVLLGLRYSFGERFLQSSFYRHSLGSDYPSFWFTFARGFNRDSPVNLSYNRFVARVDHTMNFVRYGITRFRILGGYVQGQAPYPKLFNMLGSLREPSVIIHNAFETMAYNEFLSNRFAAIFVSHSFPKVVLSERFKIEPVPQVIQNYGIGALRNPQDQDFPFRTMERGYFETGFIVNDLLNFNIAGFKVGLGVGTFLRYGPYAMPSISDNFVFKYALVIGI